MVFLDVHCLTLDQDVPDDVVLRVGLCDGGGDRLLTQEGQEFAALFLDGR